jgi:hypothetical protein
MKTTVKCDACGKKLKIVDSTYMGPEDHRVNDCIKHLAGELQKLCRMLGIKT